MEPSFEDMFQADLASLPDAWATMFSESRVTDDGLYLDGVDFNGMWRTSPCLPPTPAPSPVLDVSPLSPLSPLSPVLAAIAAIDESVASRAFKKRYDSENGLLQRIIASAVVEPPTPPEPPVSDAKIDALKHMMAGQQGRLWRAEQIARKKAKLARIMGAANKNWQVCYDEKHKTFAYVHPYVAMYPAAKTRPQLKKPKFRGLKTLDFDAAVVEANRLGRIEFDCVAAGKHLL